MTSAATPKGLRRRSRLITAASELLVENGLDAVRHRTVAERAGLPLASTTYYFHSLDDLVFETVAHVISCDDIATRERAAATTRRRRTATHTAEVLTEVFVGTTSAAAIAARVETVVLARRVPQLQQLLSHRRGLVTELHVDVLDKCERDVTSEAVLRLMAVADGTVIATLPRAPENRASESIGAAVQCALTDVVDLLAPLR